MSEPLATVTSQQLQTELATIVSAFFSRENITQLLDELPFSLWIKDVHGHFAGANQQWLNDNGLNSPSELVGRDDYDFSNEVEAATRVRLHWQAIDTARTIVTTEQRDRDGVQVLVRTTHMPLRSSSNEVIGVVGFSQQVELTCDDSKAPSAGTLSAGSVDIDPVTGAGSREALHNRLTELLDSGKPTALLLLSLDDFEVINDSLGHEFGDNLLRSAAKRLTTAFGPHLFRHRGDEFAVVLPTLDPSYIDEVTTTVLDKWRGPMFIDGTEIYGSISIGISPLSGRTRSSLVIQDAELALHEAKASGGNVAVTSNPEHRAAADEKLSQQMLVRRAVANREFLLHWQPIFDAETGWIQGCEALLRWQPAGGSLTLPAADFFPFLERSGLIVQVGKFVIETACRQHASWLTSDKIGIPVPIFVNVSRRQFASGGIVDDILATLQEFSVNPNQLTVEIDDAHADATNDDFINSLRRLRAAGVQVAIDNFGSGDVTLTSLLDLPVDVTKIDRSLTGRIRPGVDEPILQAIQTIVRSQGQVPVVQGVETKEQLTWLRERGWKCVQGYHMAPPMDADQVGELIAERIANRKKPAITDNAEST